MSTHSTNGESKLSATSTADLLNATGPDLLEDLNNILQSIASRSNGRKRYQLQNYLGGRPGKTAVFLSTDTHLGPVALKFIACRDEKTSTRFKREIKMMCRVAHANVVATKNEIPLVSPDGTLLVAVLEYIPGNTVEQFARSLNTMGEHLVVQIAMDVLRGLAHIHHKGVIHKDVKCANILCGPDSYKIADFGISAIED